MGVAEGFGRVGDAAEVVFEVGWGLEGRSVGVGGEVEED